MNVQNWMGDEHIRRAFDWFTDVVGSETYRTSKIAIQQHQVRMNTPSIAGGLAAMEESLRQQQRPPDTLSWYLYLADTYNNEPLDYEPLQGARVMPVLRALGDQADALQAIPGIREKIALMHRDASQVDPLLFELLVAAAYVRQGWTVQLIEDRGRRMPEFKASRAGDNLYVECKRKTEWSEYGIDERMRWLDLFQPIRAYLGREEASIVLDIVFHKELRTLDQDALGRLLLPRLPLVIGSATIVDNEDMTVKVRPARLDSCRRHLQRNRVKASSTLLLQLLFDYDRQDRGISLAASWASHGPISPWVESVAWASAGIWSCDAPEAIRKKHNHFIVKFVMRHNRFPVTAEAQFTWGSRPTTESKRKRVATCQSPKP